MHVGHDANDRDPGVFRIGAALFEPPANRVLAGKEPLGECLIDDRNRPVLFLTREEPSLQQRNAEGVEKAWRDVLCVDEQVASSVRESRTAFDRDSLLGVGDGDDVGNGPGAANARQRDDPIGQRGKGFPFLTAPFT